MIGNVKNKDLTPLYAPLYVDKTKTKKGDYYESENHS